MNWQIVDRDTGAREKIEADPSRPRYLRVVHGLGYKVVALP